jgi:endogenous inhibitor of DNA gyrase (YacG/DUF329 family)
MVYTKGKEEVSGDSATVPCPACKSTVARGSSRCPVCKATLIWSGQHGT